LTAATDGQCSLWLADTADGNVGGLTYAHSTNQMEFRVNDASRMAIDSTATQVTGDLRVAGDVGIGTSNPGTALHILQNTPAIKLEDDGGAYAQIKSSNAGSLAFRADEDEAGVDTRIQFDIDGAEVMRIDDAGKVGIGTSVPLEKLHVHGQTILDNATTAVAAAVPTTVYVNDQTDPTIGFGRRAGGSTAETIIGLDDTDAKFKISMTTADVGAVSHFVLDSAGNVGIGTALPSGVFHVNNAGTGIIVANEHITGNAFEVHGAQGNLLTITDDLSDSLMSVNDAAGMPVFEVFADDTIKSYRNNESKFEVDPDNNRIRLRDDVYVSGDSHVSGKLHIHGAADYGGQQNASGVRYLVFDDNNYTVDYLTSNEIIYQCTITNSSNASSQTASHGGSVAFRITVNDKQCDADFTVTWPSS